MIVVIKFITKLKKQKQINEPLPDNENELSKDQKQKIY